MSKEWEILDDQIKAAERHMRTYPAIFKPLFATELLMLRGKQADLKSEVFDPEKIFRDGLRVDCITDQERFELVVLIESHRITMSQVARTLPKEVTNAR